MILWRYQIVNAILQLFYAPFSTRRIHVLFSSKLYCVMRTEEKPVDSYDTKENQELCPIPADAHDISNDDELFT